MIERRISRPAMRAIWRSVGVMDTGSLTGRFFEWTDDETAAGRIDSAGWPTRDSGEEC